jgi:hypothetical protein
VTRAERREPGRCGCPSIYDIKSGGVPVGTLVHVAGVLVTGHGTNGFFVQVRIDAGYTGRTTRAVRVHWNERTADERDRRRASRPTAA